MLGIVVALYAALSVAAHDSNEEVTIAAAYAYRGVECYRTVVRGRLGALPAMLASTVIGDEFVPLGQSCDVRFAGSPVRAGCTLRIDDNRVVGQIRRSVYTRDLVDSVTSECRRRRGELQVY